MGKTDPLDSRELIEERDTSIANDLMRGGDYRLERFSETRNAWMLVKRKR